MPIDTTRIIPTRRSQRKITEEELRDIEVKRIRGELSCAECRRLKLKCDKKVPCSSCVRRGCDSICPCGILSAGQGTRFILADTDHLHSKITEMSNRIRQLEDALAILQVTISDKPHPLLKEDLLKINFGSEAIDPRSPTIDEEDGSRVLDALGTLTLEDSGESRYYGRSGGVETLMMASEEDENTTLSDMEEREDDQFMSPTELETVSELFPFTGINMPGFTSITALESQLPPPERASSLVESYCSHASYFYRPVKREELLNILLPCIYSKTNSPPPPNEPSPYPEGNQEAPVTLDLTRPHDLATLFFIFALGTLLDLNLPPYNSEAERYYNLGRAALSLKPVYESPSISTVQALGLMATYHSHAGRKYSRDSAWCIMGFAAKLAQSIGLHRDSARWRMDPVTVQKRRNLFWETFAADVSHSLALGRPPTIHLSYVDCEFPLDEEATLDNEGVSQHGFWRMKHIFGRDTFYAVAEATLSARSLSYKMVLDLDHKVRELSFPAAFKPYATSEDSAEEFHSSSLSLRGFYASQYRTVTMLYLHRSFFAQAVLDYPANPLLSPLAPSFLTAYRCASVVIRAAAHQFERCAPLAMRLWFLLCQTFSAAVIVGTVVTRSPNSTVAASALLDLDLAVNLFKKTAPQSYRARVALGVLRKLKEKAVWSYNQSCSTSVPAQVNGNSLTRDPKVLNIFSTQSLNDAEDELAIFGGQTRILTRKTKHKVAGSSTPVSSPESNASPRASPISIPSPPFDLSSMPDVHPSLIEYLKHDSVRRSHAPSRTQTLPTTISSPSTTSTTQQTTRRRTTSRSHSNRDMEEVYSSFVGYLANKSIASVPVLPGVVPPYMQGYRPPTQGNQTPNPQNLNANTSTPSVINQWEQASGTLSQQSPPRQDSSTISSGMPAVGASTPNPWTALNPANAGYTPAPPNQYFTGMDTSASNSMEVSGLMAPVQGGMSGVPYQGRMDSLDFQSYGASSYMGSNYFPGTAPSTQCQDPVDSMVEMGLTSESGMDEGWLSFMRECGIMDQGKPRV